MKKFLHGAFLPIIIIGLLACATAEKPGQAVYLIQSRYNQGLTLAVAYKALPTCEAPGAPALCSQPAIVTKLQQADDVAAPALMAAQATVRAPDMGADWATVVKAAQIAVDALTAITASLPPPAPQ